MSQGEGDLTHATVLRKILENIRGTHNAQQETLSSHSEHQIQHSKHENKWGESQQTAGVCAKTAVGAIVVTLNGSLRPITSCR